MELAEEILGVTKAKTELPGRLQKLQSGQLDRVVLVKYNSPVAVIVTMEEYDTIREVEAMREELEDLRIALEAMRADNGMRVSLDDLKKQLNIK